MVFYNAINTISAFHCNNSHIHIIPGFHQLDSEVSHPRTLSLIQEHKTGVYCIRCFFNNKILDWSKLKAITGNKINATDKLKFVLGWVENIAEKGRKCWFPEFLPLPAVFPKLEKASFLGLFSRDCVVKNKNKVYYSYYVSMYTWCCMRESIGKSSAQNSQGNIMLSALSFTRFTVSSTLYVKIEGLITPTSPCQESSPCYRVIDLYKFHQRENSMNCDKNINWLVG